MGRISTVCWVWIQIMSKRTIIRWNHFSFWAISVNNKSIIKNRRFLLRTIRSSVLILYSLLKKKLLVRFRELTGLELSKLVNWDSFVVQVSTWIWVPLGWECMPSNPSKKDKSSSSTTPWSPPATPIRNWTSRYSPILTRKYHGHTMHSTNCLLDAYASIDAFTSR